MSGELPPLAASLTAAVGEDPALHAELRAAFLSGARAYADTFARAAEPVQRAAAAWRLHGLAASFGALDLMACASQAATRGPDPLTMRRIHAAIDALDR